MMFGYLTWYDETETIIINNYKNNIFFTIAKGAMGIVLFFAVPININPARFTFL